MITVVKNTATLEQREHLISWLESQHVQVHVSEGREYTVLGLVGDTSHIDMELLESLDGWSRIRCRGRTGWMMTEFLVTDESMSGNEGLQTFRVIISGLDLTQAQALVNNYPGRSRMEEDV